MNEKVPKFKISGHRLGILRKVFNMLNPCFTATQIGGTKVQWIFIRNKQIWIMTRFYYNHQ